MNCAFHSGMEAVYKCTGCGADICETCRIIVKNEDYCKKCVAQKIEGAAKTERSPFLACLLSFFIGGAGQVYNGQAGKGILIFLTSFLILPWIFGIFDAYITAKKINSGLIKARPQTGCLAAILVTALIIFIMIPIVALLAAIAIPNFIKARQETMGRRGPVISIQKESATVETESQEPVTSGNNTFSDMIQIKKAQIYKVYLQNGQIFEAQIEKDKQDAYVFKIGNGTFEVSKQEVVEIKKME